MKALSAALRTEEWFGAGHLIDILTGNETDKTRARGHDRLPTWGVGQDLARREWQAVFRQMMGLDLRPPRPGPPRRAAGHREGAPGAARRGTGDAAARHDPEDAGRARRSKAMVAEEDAPLLSALKAKRRALAEAQRVPAYVVFTDRTLIEMAETRPARSTRWRASPASGRRSSKPTAPPSSR